MAEILAALCAAARDAGHDAGLVSSEFPPPDAETAYVVIPHEHYECEPASAWPTREQRARTIALCVENPFTPWFEAVCGLVPQFARVLAINRSSVTELWGRGIPAEHLQLGYAPDWDRWHGEERPRPIDVTYLGSADSRRDALVAGYGRWLWRRRTAMLVPPLAPKPSTRADYLVDGVKFGHLGLSKLLVNLHREGSSSFEWVRALQAIVNGCIVVSEPSLDHAPLVPGEHFVVAGAESIPHVVHVLLQEPERIAAVRNRAYELVRSELGMESAIGRLVAAAEELVAVGSRLVLPAAPPAPRLDRAPRKLVPPDEAARLRSAVRNLGTETLELRRMVQRLLERSEGRDPDGEPEVVTLTPTFRDARPRVSVAITVHNYEREVVEALRSVEASEFDGFEVLVIDDASTDGSLEAVRDFLTQRPWLPATLLHNRVNRGLGASRNALARHARGEMMFVLDADNAIYPTALGRLFEALDGDPGATFVYPLIAVTRFEEPVGLLSRYAWDPEGFTAGNYIDAMALIRLDDFWALGGYTEDPRLTSWEDFHLWCACAESGRRGRLVPEVLARYRTADHSMLAWTQTDVTVAWSLMHSRFPTIVPSTPVE
jgi:Glycosyl transferase family 2